MLEKIKTIEIKILENEYYSLLKLKGKEKSWYDFLIKGLFKGD